MCHADDGAVARSRPSGRLRPKPSPTTAHQLPDGCPVSASAEPSPAEASSNPAPTNPGRGARSAPNAPPPRPKPKKTLHPASPGRGARSAPNAPPPAAEAEEDVTSSESRTGCLVVTTPHPPRPKPRRMLRTAASGRVPGRHHAPPSAAEAEEDVAQQLPDDARSAPRSTFRGRNRKRRHTTSPGRVPDPAPPARGRSEQPLDPTQIPDGVAVTHPKPKLRTRSRSTTRHRRVPCSYPRPKRWECIASSPLGNPLPSCGHENA